MTEKKNYFSELAALDVSEHVEKKGQFSYLSWPFAVETLGKLHPDATWEVKRFPLDGGVLVPYLSTPVGYFVEVEVTVSGVTKGQIHPILDNKNRPIKDPNPFDINTSIQRCLVKAIALHGLGLYIYAGEDLPTGVTPPAYTEKEKHAFDSMLNADDALGIYLLQMHMRERDGGDQAYADLFNSGETGSKMKTKGGARKLEAQGKDIYNAIRAALSAQDDLQVKENIEGCLDGTIVMLTKRLNNEERAILNDAMVS